MFPNFLNIFHEREEFYFYLETNNTNYLSYIIKKDK
jgi:hypothetical protein